MGVGLDLFGGLVCVTSVEKDKFPTENFPEIKGSYREISAGKYTTERKERSSWAKLAYGAATLAAALERCRWKIYIYRRLDLAALHNILHYAA